MCRTMRELENVINDYRDMKTLLEEVSKEQPKALTKMLEWAGVPIKKEAVHIDDAAGRVCAMSIIPYPPGIPIACPGEVLDKELLEYVKERRLLGEKVIGINEDMMIQVGKI
mgnify:CR=1 FL=1